MISALKIRIFGLYKFLQSLVLFRVSCRTIPPTSLIMMVFKIKEVLILHLKVLNSARLEAENSAKLAEMEEIRSELLLRGDIQRVWEEKLNEVKAYGLEAVRDFDTAIHDLEQEKYERDKSISEKLKEEAAHDCQKQLLLNLKEEVNEMSERLVCEKANYATEQQSSEQMSTDLQSKQEAILEVKSILEAEKEALQILRSWIEDEAKRSQAQAHILEQVGRRWKWTNGA